MTVTEGWRILPLSEVVLLQRGFDLPAKERRPGLFPVLTSGDTGGTHDQGPIKGPGVVVGRASNIGRPKWSVGDFWPHNTTMFVKDFMGNEPRWVYHLFENTDLAGFNSGSVQPMLNRNYIAGVQVAVPPLPVQLAISGVLGAIDDKILANTKLIAALDEHMGAMVLSRSLGGRRAELDEIVEFHNRKRIPLSASEREARKGKIPYYGASGEFGRVDDALFNFPIVLVGEDGSVINDDSTPVTQYIWGPAWVNNHAHVLTGKGLSTELLFQIVRRSNVSMLVTGAAQPKVNMGNLKRLEVVIPKPEELAHLEAVVSAETALKRSLATECRDFAELRQTLLPALMSGRIRAKEARSQVGDAF